MGRRSWWICWDAMNGGKQFVVDRKPSGISAGGNMVNVQAREVFAGDVVLSADEAAKVRDMMIKISENNLRKWLTEIADETLAILDRAVKET